MPERIDRLVAAGIGHPWVQEFRNVKANRRPRRSDLVAVEGVWSVRHALAAGHRLEALFVCRSLLRGDDVHEVVAAARATGAACLEVAERVLLRLVDRDGPDGVAALVRLPPRSLSDVRVDGSSRVLVSDGLELAGNVGTIIRCADGAGVAGVLVTDPAVRLDHPLVVKASMGTIFSTPVVAAPSEEALAWLRERSFTIVAADPSADVSYRAPSYAPPVAVVVGSERHGLSPFWLDAADAVVSIPMLGVADSLNVGHAAALLLYEVLSRQRTVPELPERPRRAGW